MKKVININFQGQVIAIEETAYEILNQYIESLKRYFSREEDGDEIVNDIECRIAELFGNRLKHGISCITDEDVQSIITSIGKPEDFDTDYEETPKMGPDRSQAAPAGGSDEKTQPKTEEHRSLYRNANDRIIGGVCSGLAHYFKTDPVWLRIIFVLLFGFLFWVYIVLWIVLKPKALDTNVTKRLYRNPNDRFLAGICGGMAAFFKIDSWIPRVLFLLPLLLNVMGMISFFPLNHLFGDVDFSWNVNMSMVVVYVVLWIIIPEAKTVKQKLEMMGEEEYIRSIRERVNDNVASARNRTESQGPAVSQRPAVSSNTAAKAAPYAAMDTQSKEEWVSMEGVTVEGMPPVPPAAPSRVTNPPSSERPGCVNGLIILLKIIFFSIVSIFALVLVGLFIGFMVAGAQLMPLKALFIDPGQETQLLIASLVLIILIPVVTIVIWIIRRVMKAKSRPMIGIIATVLWFVGFALAGVLATSVAEKYKVESSGEKTITLAPVTSEKMYVEMEPYNEDYAEFKAGFGIGIDIDELPYTTVNADSLLFRDIHLQIRQSDDSLFHVRTIAASRGLDLRSAKAAIGQFSYPVVQRDSLLVLPEFLSVPVSQGYREQSITVKISVPAGKTVEVNDALSEYKNNQPPSVVRKRIRRYSRTYTPGEVSTPGEDSEHTATSDSI